MKEIMKGIIVIREKQRVNDFPIKRLTSARLPIDNSNNAKYVFGKHLPP